MNLPELAEWIARNFEVREGLPRSYYEKVDHTPGTTVANVVRHTYVAHVIGVRDYSLAVAENDLCHDMLHRLQLLHGSVHPRHYGPLGKPVLTVRSPLNLVVEKYTEFVTGGASIKKAVVEDGDVPIPVPSNYEFRFDTDAYHEVKSRGEQHKIYFRFCVEHAAPDYHRSNPGEGMFVNFGSSNAWQASDQRSIQSFGADFMGSRTRAAQILSTKAMEKVIGDIFTKHYVNQGQFQSNDYGQALGAAANHSHQIADPGHCHGQIYGGYQDGGIRDPGHYHGCLDPGLSDQPVIFGFEPPKVEPFKGYQHDDRLEASAYGHKLAQAIVQSKPDLHVKHSSMTEAKYAALVAAQDAPKVEPSRYEVKQQLAVKAVFDRHTAAMVVKPAPKGIIAWQ